jgi:hypothetical protein
MRALTIWVALVAILGLAVTAVVAQTPARPPAVKGVEGTVEKVDPATRSVKVSAGQLGLFGATVEVTDATRISVDGRGGSLGDIRKGAKVKATYQTRNGKNVAMLIDVMSADEIPSSAARDRTSGGSYLGTAAGTTPPAGAATTR